MGPLDVFRAEAERLSGVLGGLSEPEYLLPTPCPPWNVRGLAAHVRTGAGRLITMLAAPPPTRAEVDAAAYFGPAKFAPGTDADRVDTARREGADFDTGRALAEDFDRTWRAAYAAAATAAPDRLVRTRHGDPMTLDEFLVTRVVELGVHGLDLATALGREPWLTAPAGELIAGLLTRAAGEAASGLADELRWDRLTLISKATGRRPLTDAERGELDRRGVRWLAFG